MTRILLVEDDPGIVRTLSDFLWSEGFSVDAVPGQRRPLPRSSRRNDDQLAISRHREVDLIYQFYNLIPVLNVRENITLPVLMDGRKVNEARLQELLHTLGLESREKHLPHQLSGGQQQRVSIGRALMNAPAGMLEDEPTGNLDSKNSQEIVDLLKFSNRRYEQALIVITHDENIALQADRIIAIEDGKITRDEVIRK